MNIKIRGKGVAIAFLAWFNFLFSCNNQPSPDTLYIKFMSIGYNAPTLFIYQAALRDSLNHLIRIDTISLYSSGVPKKHDKQKIMFYRFLSMDSSSHYQIKIMDNQRDTEFTGIKCTDDDLFMHPPRSHYFRILEFCPYPYFRNYLSPGETYEWDFKIGPFWAIDSVYPLRKVEVFQNHYQYIDTMSIKSNFGYIHCFKIKGTGKSIYGSSSADFYLNDALGLIKYDATSINLLHFNFELIGIFKNRDSIINVSMEYLKYMK